MRPCRTIPSILALTIMLGAGITGLGVLVVRPAASLAEASGLYAPEGESAQYRWTSNRVQVPIHGGSGPTIAALTLGPAGWPGRPSPTVTLASDQEPLATFRAPDALRRYLVLLSPSSSFLTLETSVNKPSAHDHRWLGVPIYHLTATATGLPLRAAAQALALGLAALLLTIAVRWGVRRGLGIEIALALLALALRGVMLDVAPAGWRADAVVSLVDAWHLSQTGRDYYGHLLPLGAQEGFGDWISPLLTYLELPFVALFGPQRLVGRAVTAVYGALAAPLCYRLGRALDLPSSAAICAGLVAALSPWQILLSRNGMPPALVPTSWALCLLAALLFLRRGGRSEALVLAAAAGVALYAYPTMKLAVPLLVALALALALLCYGWRAAKQWLLGALLLALLWLPFVYVTLYNPASGNRLSQTMIAADTWAEWWTIWWQGYSVYFQPDFYYISGDSSPIRGVPGYGVELLVTAPLVVLGALALLYRLRAAWKLQLGDWRTAALGSTRSGSHFASAWWLIAGASLIAPLPSSLTFRSPHIYRAALIAPIYALLAGLGVAALWRLLERAPDRRARRVAQATCAAALCAALTWQAGAWFRYYVWEDPPLRAWDNQDGLSEAMRRAVAYAPGFDEVWMNYNIINEPHIYLLAAQPMPPLAAQAQLVVRRNPGLFNTFVSIERYRFGDLEATPRDLPVLEAIPDQFGGPAFLLQQWQHDGKRILVLQRMD